MKSSVLKVKRREHAPTPPQSSSQDFAIVGIGASAGGLEAASELLRRLPEKTGMAFVLVQHLDPKHGSELRVILARTTKIPVVEVSDGTVVEPNHIYVIPPNTTMELHDGKLRLAPRVLTPGHHLPIDLFLRSLAEARGERAVSVILSGAASDGTEGSRAIKAAGGITFAQDAKSAKYSSMPQSAAGAGCVDFVLPPAAIAKELSRIANHPYLVPAAIAPADLPVVTEVHVKALLALILDATGVDFTHYKQTTLLRRIKRRMALQKLEGIKDYVRFVRNTPGEIEDLYRDILIHVTGFFRDPQSFEALRKDVFPYLFRGNKNGGTVRVWVPGCSTGEEVYSLAMVMLEYLWLETQKTAKAPPGNVPFQIFATDISDTALDRARAGFYSDALAAGLSPERLRRFFLRLEGGYQIIRPVREMCVFARQNVAKDPPFSNIDLISCRNLLIYLGPPLQKRVLPTLHYALKPEGYLILGESESLGIFSDYFTPVDKKSKIFQKKKSSARLATHFGGIDFGIRRIGEAKVASTVPQVFAVEKEVDRLLMNRFVPASIVVNDGLEIVHFRGKTGPYLEPADGRPTFSLSKMARQGLLVDLRTTLTKARKERCTVRKEGVHVDSDGHPRVVNLEVTPLRSSGLGEHFYVVVFEDAIPGAAGSGERKSQKKIKGGDSQEKSQLKRELTQIREQFQVLLTEHETTQEEFKSANEEVLSANEELQSTNEELETAKEELQSTNEELTTLNEELQNRNEELSAGNNDLLNLLGNVSVPIVIVDRELRIRRFTPPAQKLLNLLPADVGRRLTEIRPNLAVNDLGQMAQETIAEVTSREQEVQENGTGLWYLMRVSPYKTWDNKIDGAVISFHDIDIIKRNLEQARQFAEALVENAREAILVLDTNLRVVHANQAFYRQFDVTHKETEGLPIYELGNAQWNIPQLRELLETVLPGNGCVQDFEVTHDFPRLGKRTMMLNAHRTESEPGQQSILLYIQDVTRSVATPSGLERA